MLSDTLFDINKEIKIKIIEIRNGVLRLEIECSEKISPEEIHIELNGDTLIEPEEIANLKVKGFLFKIPLFNVKQFRLVAVSERDGIKGLRPRLGKFAKLQYGKKGAYYRHDDKILRLTNDGRFYVLAGGLFSAAMCEIKYDIGTVLRDGKFGIAWCRICAFIKKNVCKKSIWIISDRDDIAGDNGEAFFRYVNGKKDNDIKCYFAIKKSSRDYARLKQYGKVLKLNSYSYKINFLCAEKVISAHADPWVIHAFPDEKKYVGNMYDFDYIFLQHGIIGNDMSNWLNRFNKNIAVFITSTRAEQRSIIEYDYGYDEETVKLTGLARYDCLQDMREKLVILCPTWRLEIAGETEAGTSHRTYNPEFKTTEYFKFFNELINNAKLVSAMKEYGYSGEFYLHPAILAQKDDFAGNDTIKVMSETADYNDIFRRASLMVTDLSSVAFDFGYLKKPIVYSQFDFADYYGEHFYEPGYFNYEEDGFGPVCRDMGKTVNEMINYIKNGCTMEDNYIQRVDDFFEFNDKKNCERIYNEIKFFKL